MYKILIPFMCLVVGVSSAVRALEISPDSPAFVFAPPPPGLPSPTSYVESVQFAWENLPEFFQAHGVIEVPYQSGEATARLELLKRTLEPLNESNIPLAITVARGAGYEFLKPGVVDDLLKAHPNVKLIRVERLQLDAAPDYGDLSELMIEPIAGWLEQMIAVADDRNVQLVLELDGLTPIKLMSDPRYADAYRAMSESPDTVILTYAQGDFHTLTGNSALVGMWLEGAIGHWGVALDSTEYLLSGLLSPGQLGINLFVGAMPSSVYRAWILQGAMTGAELYWFRRGDELWAGAQSRYWDEVISPTLLQITSKAYIARKDLVSREAAVAYRLGAASTPPQIAANLNDVDPVFHNGNLFQAAYGVTPAAPVPEWTANSGDFYIVPILSPYASEDTLFSFKEVLTPGAVMTVQAFRDRLRAHYPAVNDSQAYVHKVGRAIFVLHSLENSYGSQTYTLADGPAPLYDITATREGNSVTVAWPFREGDVSYSVYRAIDPDMDALDPDLFIEIATGIEVRTYKDEDVPPGSTVLYSVTAVTNENAPISGVVDFGQYRIMSAVESRVDAFAFIEPYTMRSRSVNGFGIPDPADAPTLENWSSIPEDAEEHVKRAYTNVEAVLQTLGDALRAGDVDRAMTLFTEDYSDGKEGNRGSLRGVMEALVATKKIGPVQFQVQVWDRNDFEFSGEIVTNCFTRILTLDSDTMTTQSIPSELESVLSIRFKEDFNAEWKIKRVEPALITIVDLLGRTQDLVDVQR